MKTTRDICHLVLPVHSTRSITLILFLKRKKNANIVGASGNTLPLTVHSHLRENYFVLEAGLRKVPPILAPYTRQRNRELNSWLSQMPVETCEKC